MSRLPNWLKFVSIDKIEQHLEEGWEVLVPNAPHHHAMYGAEMGWFHEHEPPAAPVELNRVPINSTQESANNERAG